MIRFGPAASPPQVWAVEDTAVQVTWGNLPPGPVRARADDCMVSVEHRGGPGGLVIDGLPPDSPVSVELTWTGGRRKLAAKTLPSPPGELLARFATVSDLHLGAERWGAMKTMVDQTDHPVPHPYRCAIAAVNEAVAWGAELLVIKGDAAQHECRADFAEVGRLVDEFPSLPMLLIPGNHDVDGRNGGTIPLTVGRRQLPYTRTVDSIDLPGARIVAADTALPGQGRGSLTRTGAAVVDEIAGSDRPVFLAVHHQLQATRLPRHWPVGISAPASTDFLSRLDRLDVPITVSSGHTHRNRSRLHGDVLVTEVASTKDWPGVWAGYAVHEGGIRQVVRRTADPDAIAWTEYSRGALNGLWAMWSPGPIGQRCISRPWARRGSLV
ncbi:MAG: metallophosphoesterase family protein [Acidimicrobiales bacterium]